MFCTRVARACLVCLLLCKEALDSGKILIGVILDLKKAFDTVNHKILRNYS